MASPAPGAASGSRAQRLAAVTRSRQPALPIRVQYHANDCRRHNLADNESVLQAIYRTPHLKTCKLEPSQIALEAYTSASGSTAHDRGVCSLRVTARAIARLLDAADKDDVLSFFDTAAIRRESWVPASSYDDATVRCHWHKLATERLQAATQSTHLLLIISMSVAGAVFPSLFYDGKHVILDNAIARARAGISSRWRYPKLQESKQRRDELASSSQSRRSGHCA